MYRTDKIFDKASTRYDVWYMHGEGAQVFKVEVEGIDRLLPEKGLGLEVGGGTGAFTSALRRPEREIICVDPSPGMLRLAVEKNLPSVLAAGESEPFRRRLFDFAYIVTALEFISEPVAALRETVEVLKEGATLATLTINRESPWGAFYTTLKEQRDTVFSHAKLFSIDEAREMINQVKAQIVEALGTLTSPPNSEPVNQELVEPSEKTGVILLKSIVNSETAAT